MTTTLTVPLRLSERVVADPPVVLAPMAGITNTAFRRLCREAMQGSLAPGQAGGLFVSEMITSRALVERNPKTMRLVRFAADEQPRSIQLYGVDP
ncbi:MAG: tRNA dihydrouridine synthase DusB, partial [Pseudonocardiales bacterium]|nr:tRNA dihydrouridine synthase DusB [Pseudonocardiales bacterium]